MLIRGDLFDVLPTVAAASLDACVTDPPYGISFMAKAWDNFSPAAAQQRIVPNRAIGSANPNLKGRTRGPASSPSAVEYNRSLEGQRGFQDWTQRWATEVYRVLKPGAYLVVCGAPRSHHRMMCGLEDAGFVIRDCFAWLFGSGFPKNYNLGDGKGTALKPAHEPIALAWKPFTGSIKATHAKHGTAALNIDACRLDGEPWTAHDATGLASEKFFTKGHAPVIHKEPHDLGRWPANVLLDEEAATQLDEQTANVGGHGVGTLGTTYARDGHGFGSITESRRPHDFSDAGGASRFYYVAKPSREERDYGCDSLPTRRAGSGDERASGSMHERMGTGDSGKAVYGRNNHPTVKPVELMRWLVKLVTPVGGTVLDPFTGSGTTGMACRYELREFLGIEKEPEYIAIAERRIAAVCPLFGEVPA